MSRSARRIALELIELAGECGVGGEQVASHEGAHDVDAHLDGAGAVEHIGRPLHA
jgi:hypothetical protein